MSIRRNRFDYLAQVMTPARPKVGVMDVVKAMAQRVKRELREAGVTVAKKKKPWDWDAHLGGKSYGGRVFAHTRSEARAEVKKSLGIKKGRLPIGVVLENKSAVA